MVFIVKKKIHGKEYYYLNENKRINGKVKTKTLAYLGKNKKQAEKKAEEIIKKLKEEQMTKKLKETKKITKLSIEDMATFCKRKGFVYPSSEIYGGFAGFWDFGYLGVELANNIKKEWWKFHVHEREDVVGIDGSIITNPKVWKASGHVESFIDVAIVNKKTKERFKVDKFEAKKYEKDPNYEVKGEFNPMFTVQVGPIKEESVHAYLRPETAQLIFANFKNTYESARMKLPFGIAQIGKAFRNEIAPRDFLFRTREFEQMEIEYFIKPKSKCPLKIGESNLKILVYSTEMQEKNKKMKKMSFKEIYQKGIMNDWHAYWLEQEFLWFVNLGADKEKFRVRQHLKDERSHYSLDTWDLEYNFPFGWKELEGFANRTDFDLRQHEKFSGKDLKIFDEQSKEKFFPHVICEPSLGVGRAFLVFMFDSYFYDEKRKNIVLKLNPKLSPIKAAIFPIIKTNKKILEIAKEIFNDLKKNWNVTYDERGSIGRRYSRADEIGVPFCITIDEESLKNNDVTIRERDTTKQIRIKVKKLKEILRKAIEEEKNILKFGKKVETRKKSDFLN